MPRASQWRAKAQSLIDQGALDRAEDCLAMALEAEPTPSERVWILLMLMALCEESGREDEAAEYLDQAAKRERDPLALGHALYQAGAHGLAAALFGEAARRSGGDARAHRWLGAARAATGDMAGATRAFEEAIAKDLSDHSLRYDFAVALAEGGEISRAIQQLHIVLQHDSKHLEARTLKATLAYRQREYRQAAIEYEHVVQAGGGSPEIHEALAASYLHAGERLRAARALEACTRAHPTHWPNYLLAGRLFEAVGKPGSARRFFHAASYIDAYRVEALAALERLSGHEDAPEAAHRLPARPPSLTARLGPSTTGRLNQER